MLQGSDFVSYIWMYAALLHTIIGLHAQIAISIFSFIAMLLFWRVSLLRWIFLTILILVAGPRLFVSSGKIVSDALTTTVIKYKIIIEVETPEGLKTGSNVVQVTITPKFVHWNPSASPIIIRVEGEAIFLDLGQGKNVIATLGFGPTGANEGRLSRLPSEVLGGDNGQSYTRARTWEGRAELHGDLIPTMVTFGDLADPYTVQVVMPDEFATVFGPGYRFKGAWIEMTMDDVTRAGIEEKLPWIYHMSKYVNAGNAGALSTPFTNKLDYSMLLFKRGN
ncbi:hypothetical protein [Solidesulfovibrio magneticus]|uniref:Uncharacterized protein n=1 Tax=Solidesulfovibrio magneticus (strain ATCC 700980 / DSM 13731 / RS-1) TaxID=573370 RepID=C4XMZ9_SOLM1|nr:hypothetical protein [Solidesulfovibrio magneticus]BAH77302.1 hypothetical protein DMR_38110 [Solidesulfovibrio magneticus RS-1]